jgi:Carbohydrate esterase, sialic acid-specific acetylesterase
MINLGLFDETIITRSLNLSSLSALPSTRKSAVINAANLTSKALGISAQSVIDAIGRCPEWWDWRSNTFTDAGATVLAIPGQNVQTFKGVRAGLVASQSNSTLRPVLGSGGIVFESDMLVSPSTGFPTGNSTLGCVTIIDFALNQSQVFPTPFSYAAANNDPRRFSYLPNDSIGGSSLIVAGFNAPNAWPGQIGINGSSSYFLYSPTSGGNFTYRLQAENEVIVAATQAPNFQGNIHFGGFLPSPETEQLYANCTIRQFAFTNSLADTRIVHRFLRFLEGIDLPPIKLPSNTTFVFIGESNSGGSASNSSLGPEELDPNPSIQILNNSSLTLEPLDIGSNNLIGHFGAIDQSSHGWEAGLQINTSGQCYLVKCGQGGSTISQWNDGGSYQNTFEARINAFQSLVPSANYRVWLSFGINDAAQGTAPATWRASTENWISRIRTKLGSPTIKVYATKLMANTSQKIAYNLQLDAMAAADPNFILLDTSSILTYPLITGDPNHWNSSSMKRMARGFLSLEFPS